MHSLAALVFLAAATSGAAQPPAAARPKPRPKAGFEMLRVALYQKDEVLQARLASVDELAGYIKKLQETCVASLSDVTKSGALDVVVAVKPGRRSRVWFLTSTTLSPGPARLAALQTQLQAIPPPEVRNGPLALAIIGGLGSVRRPHEAANDLPAPIPTEWAQAAKGKKNVSVPDGMLALLWPE